MSQNSLMTHFELVGEFHDTFEHPLHTELNTNCYEKDPGLIPFRIRFMREELNEFIEDHGKGNIEGMADALCDLSYVTNGAGHCLGFNLDSAMRQYNVDISTNGEYNNVDLDLIKNKAGVIKVGVESLENVLAEFIKFADARDFPGMELSLVKMLNEVYCFGHLLGFNMDKMYREVHRANMTKKCSTEEEARQSVLWYLQDGRYKTPAYRVKKDYYVVYDVSETKVLKNYKWEEPNLKQFF